MKRSLWAFIRASTPESTSAGTIHKSRIPSRWTLRPTGKLTTRSPSATLTMLASESNGTNSSRMQGTASRGSALSLIHIYWSDHCRHTTFTTELEGITVEESFVKEEIEDSLALYLRIRRELGREHKSLCLMDMATIGARYLLSLIHI